jgi:hypothetical protein
MGNFRHWRRRMGSVGFRGRQLSVRVDYLTYRRRSGCDLFHTPWAQRCDAGHKMLLNRFPTKRRELGPGANEGGEVTRFRARSKIRVSSWKHAPWTRSAGKPWSAAASLAGTNAYRTGDGRQAVRTRRTSASETAGGLRGLAFDTVSCKQRRGRTELIAGMGCRDALRFAQEQSGRDGISALRRSIQRVSPARGRSSLATLHNTESAS